MRGQTGIRKSADRCAKCHRHLCQVSRMFVLSVAHTCAMCHRLPAASRRREMFHINQ